VLIEAIPILYYLGKVSVRDCITLSPRSFER
jgi:hypothetical protein